jgi:cytochrome c biogenesis protein CcdA/thiol-disulfide isomerase/thioredoxin
MLLLIAIGLLAGIVTAISPCVLPVLPILLAGGATGRQPLRIVGGLVLSFSFFTLFATWVLDALGLPDDVLRKIAIAALIAMAVVLLLPQAALLLERALAPFSRMRPANVGNGFGLGLSLGLVFVPCAGPFLGAISSAAAHHSFGLRSIIATLSYALGAAIPMLAIALGGRQAASRIRHQAARVRQVSGVAIAVVAVGLIFHLDDHLTNLHIPGLNALENRAADSAGGAEQLGKLRGVSVTAARRFTPTAGLHDYGQAPPLHLDGAWINSSPLTLAQLRGKVVLIDFWTYSCINCLRTLPHLKSWYATYHDKGLVIIGVHTPEFAFEHETSNVRAAVKRLGIKYPVMQDNRYKTWDNYANQYWPAEYLIDKQGHVRDTHFGEGEYDHTESLIRRLLSDNGAHARHIADATPSGLLTPESYLGYARLTNYVGTNPVPNKFTNYAFPSSLPANTLAYDGSWRVSAEAITAGKDARLRLQFEASNVYIVMGGHGTVRSFINGKPTRSIRVNAQRLYTVRSGKPTDALLELRFSPGVQAYSFTFG